VATSSSTLSPEDVRAIEAVHRKWMAEELSGNARAVIDLCAEHVVWLPPGGRPLRGRQTILRWLSGPPVPILSLDLSNVEIRGDGRVAYKTAEYVTTSQPPGSRGTVTDRGAHLWVLEKGDDGAWLIVVATWTMM
jgi:uncharacterized protein (TIGR02246 family)